MAYQKRNFKKDQLLTADDLNAMDDQIASNEESAKKANDDIKNKLDKSAVVKEKGDSETAVMSQAAATKEFGKLSEEIVGVSEEITPLVLGVDLIDDNPNHIIMLDGSVVETANQIGVSRRLACKVGASISIKLSSSNGALVFAVYNAVGELTHSLVAGGYANYVEETYTFTDTDVSFRFAGASAHRKAYSVAYNYTPKFIADISARTDETDKKTDDIIDYSESLDVTNLISLEGGINKEGNVYVSTAYKYSDYIFLTEGSVVIGSNVRASKICIIAVYDKNKIFDTERSVIGNSVKENVELVMPYDGFVRLSSRITELENGGTFVITNKIGKRFDEIESELASIDKRVGDIENNSKTETNLPQYWEDYLSDKIESIIQKDMLIGNSGDSFVFITDVHIPRNQMFSPILIKNICEKTSVDKVFNGGDYLDNDTGENGKNTAVNRLLSWRNQSMLEYAIRGNHDLNNFNGENASNALTVSEWYALMVKQAEKQTNTAKEDYYVVDNQSQKIRYILMCSEGSYPTAWLQERLTELDGDWTVLIIQHRFWGSTIDSVSTAGNQITNAINSVYANVKATIVGIICGHTHVDHAITESTNGYLIVATTCDGLTGSTERAAKTTTEQAFDVVHIDTTNRKLYMTRIGYGADREFSY